MAYSSYGGYVYRNRARVPERSDWSLGRNGENAGAPGVWPGFVAAAKGPEALEEYTQNPNGPSGHAVLGTGPYYVALHKNYYVTAHFGHSELFYYTVDNVAPLPDGDNESPHIVHLRLGGRTDARAEGPELSLLIEEHPEIRNQCLYARLRETDAEGLVEFEWTGWSAYGAGAGLEESEEHDGPRNTRVFDVRMRELFWKPRFETAAEEARKYLDAHRTVEAAIEAVKADIQAHKAAVKADPHNYELRRGYHADWVLEELRVGGRQLAGLPDEPVEGDGTSKPDTFKRAVAMAFGDPGPEPAEEG